MPNPRVIIGAPVAERGWILPQWFGSLKAQTLQPDGFIFVYSESQDDTLEAIQEHRPEGVHLDVHHTKLPYYSRDQRNDDQQDPWRAQHFAHLRNLLRRRFLATDAEILVSLDTDVLLEHPRALELMVGMLSRPGGAVGGWDVVAPLVWLHEAGRASDCPNAGWLGGGEDFTQSWTRATSKAMSGIAPVQIDVPMAAVAMRRFVAAMCKYRPHECGEDVGFAQSLKAHGFRVGWRFDLEANHVMRPVPQLTTA